jgi:hypothetical protein
MPRTVPSQVVALIDQNFPNIKSPVFGVNHSTVAVLTAITRLTDAIPTELLTISGEDYSDLVCGVEAIRNSVVFWQQKGEGGIENPGIRGKNALSLIREALTKCPDQSPSPATEELVFIPDNALRDSIRQDISTAISALHNGEWKAANRARGGAGRGDQASGLSMQHKARCAIKTQRIADGYTSSWAATILPRRTTKSATKDCSPCLQRTKVHYFSAIRAR